MPSALASKVESLRATFNSNVTRSISWRMKQLRALEKMLLENRDVFHEAMTEDLSQSPFLTDLTEINLPLKEARHAMANLSDWMKPTEGTMQVILQPASCEVRHEPYGVVMIISPFNYPISLALKPLVGALAAGNCVLIKPSEVAPAVSAALAKLVGKYFDPSCVTCVLGGIPETTELLSLRWDKIMYTGSTHVGKIVMRAAAEHLTPVILELGGKSPAFVDKNVNLGVAARRIAWGKFANCGQTCVAPDYVLVHKDVETAFLDELTKAIRQFYGENPEESEDYSRIINSRHTERVASLIKDSEKFIYYGGKVIKPSSCYIEPTVLRNPPAQSEVMKDEIFGPVLPVISVPSIDAGVAYVNERERPLALYVFSSDKAVADSVLSRTLSGGAAINDTAIHVINETLPFGGIGNSGMGAYNGHHSFKAFSHERSVVWKPDTGLADPPVRYPPMTPFKKAVFLKGADIEDNFKAIAPVWFIILGAWLTWALPLTDRLF